MGAGVVVLLLASLVGRLWVFQRSLIYLPDDGPVRSGADLLPGSRDVVLHIPDGLDLDGWCVPASGKGAATVLVANGNGGHRGMRAPLADALSDAGLGVLLFDYRGYAGKPGSPTEEGLARDVRAAWTFLLEDAGVPGDRLVYFGESLGAAVVAELATEHPPAGLVLRSPFTDLASVAAEYYPVLPVGTAARPLPGGRARRSTVEVPTTVVLGSDDSIVPPEQSRAVAAAAGRLHRLVEVPGADHSDRVLLDGNAVVDAVDELAGRSPR